MKKWILLAVVACFAFALAACGANANNTSEATSGEASLDAAAADSELVVKASSWEFDKKEYRIKAGETVNLTLKSVGGVHGVGIVGTDYKLTGKGTIPVKFDEPGSYDMICNVPCGGGHSTMKAKLIVE
ncbi:cytochrome C oxidase subunit II [Paenibacillus sp. HB172176]|uniref:cytochrome C oxidase subunit II n=1 Tax=Paenibacillus sp. HB172176 TaxID=2493690 RepID=UPI00143B234A|nr:cytochrome C oxidase subunit II [Paenibacillus sp. HB172176]